MNLGASMDRSRTDDLLLSFLRTDPDERDDVTIADQSSAEWEDLLRKSDRHGVTPLLYHRLKTIHPDASIPADVVQILRKSYLQSAGRNMKLYQELGRVLGKIRQENIPVIALKGAHLAEVIYGNIALRPMGDVDLLVRQSDLASVEKNLLGMGYVPVECNRQVAKDICHFSYELPNNGLHLEVHWAFLSSLDRIKIDMDEQWERSRPAIIAGVDVSVLCPEDLLLYLCLHASKHLFDMGLKSFCDIFETIRHCGEKIDWKRARHHCEQAGIGNCVYLTLTLAREFVGAPVPVEFTKSIEPGDFDERFMALARGRIFAIGNRKTYGLSFYPNIVQLFGSQGLPNKATLLFGRIFPPPEEMSRLYPSPSESLRIYFYYPVRIRDLLLRHGRRAWRLVRREEGIWDLAEREMDIAPLRDWLMSPRWRRK